MILFQFINSCKKKYFKEQQAHNTFLSLHDVYDTFFGEYVPLKNTPCSLDHYLGVSSGAHCSLFLSEEPAPKRHHETEFSLTE